MLGVGLVLLGVGPAFANPVITSTPASGDTYGVGETITTQLNHGQVFGVSGGSFTTIYMNITIGANTRRAYISHGYTVRRTNSQFSYTVQAGDVDADGISIPQNSIGGPAYRSFGFGNVNRDHAAVTNQAGHKVDGSVAKIVSSNRAWLTWGNLNNATLDVELNGQTYGSSVAASHFTVSATPAIAGLSITGASATSGGTTATVTLSYSGSTALSGDRAFRVQVAPGAHSGGLTVTSTNQAIVGATGSQPRTTLSLSPASIAENGGVATVRATLSKTPVRPVTVTVTAAPVSPAVAGDFTVSTATTLTIPAGATASTGTVTVTAVNNNVVAAAKTVTVSGSVTPSGGAVDPASVTLTIPDDEPYVKVVLNPTSIAEGSVSTVTATLTTAASAAVTVGLQAVAGDTNTVAADFTLSQPGVIIPAGATVNTGLVTITAVDNMVHRPFSKSVTVRTAPAAVRTTAPVGRRLADLSATLTITEDDVLAVTLVPDPATVAENGGLSTVTATLSYPTTEAATVTVAAAAGTGAAAGDFTQAGTTLTIAANATTSTGVVTVTSVDDDAYQGSAGSRVTISGTVAGGNGVPNPADATLTRTDDETILPTVALALSEPDPMSADTISENGGVSTVTATLSGKSGEAVTVTVAAAAVASTGAVAGDFTLTGTTLTIAARATTSTGLVTVTGVDNNVDIGTATKTVTITGTSAGGTGVADPPDATLTLTDDDDATATLVLDPASILENGEVSTVTARLSNPTTAAATLTVTAAPVSPAVAADFSLSSTTTLTIAAGDTTSTGLVTVTAVDNNNAQGRKRVTVSATAAGGGMLAAPADATLILRDDEFGLAVGAVSGTVTETGGQATFTVRLNTEPSAAVTVAVASLDTSEGTVDPSLLTFTTATGAGGWDTAQTVTATGVQDSTDDADVTWQVRLDPASGDIDYNGLANVDVDVTTTDGDGPPGVTLALDPSSVSEMGGVSTVTARLSHGSGAATTLTVAAVTGAFTVGTDATIVIAAGETTAASDTVLVTAVDNVTDAPDRTATVTAAVTNDRAAADSTTMAVTGATLAITDDDPATGAVLFLAPSSVSENGGVASVAVVLSRPSSEPSTVTVTAVVGDYTVAANATLTVAAGFTVTTDTTTVTAVDDDIHQGSAGRSVTVAAALTNGQGAGAVTGGSLTLTDDETLPTLSLALSSTSISENGGVSTVTAGLSGKSSEAVTVTVGAAAGTGATAADFSLSTAATLTIAAGATTSAGVVTVTAVDDTGTTGSIQVTVSGTAAGGNSVANPANRTLTITDDDTPQTTLALDPASIAENGGVATVTATLDRTSSVAVTVTVAAAAGTGAVAGDFSLSTARTLTFAANATTSAGLVTVTAVNNTTDAPDKSVTVSGTAADSLNLTNDPPDVTLAIADDDAGPGVTLAVNPASIAEPSGVSTVTATLSHPSSEPSTVTVTAVSGAYTAGADATIVIAAGATTAASDTALIVVVDDDLHHGNAGRSATVTGTLTNGQGAGSVTGASLTITDDENLPTASLLIDPLASSISENGGIATITAQLAGLSGKSSEAVTVTVTVTAVATSGAVAGDFTQSGTTLTVAAGSRTSTGLVTVTGVDNNVDAADKLLRLSATATGGNGVQNPGLTVLTLTNDDDATASLVLDPSTITENGGVSTVTARLSHPTTEAATLTVAAAAGTGAVAADFSLSSTTTLTIAANATTSTGVVTVTAVDNAVATGNKQVTVSATAAGGRGVENPSNATLILRDDEFGLSESAVSGQATEAGGTSTFTVRLNTVPTAAVTVAVTSRDASEGTVSPPALTFAPGAYSTPQTVTVTGVQDTIDDGTVTWQVRLDPSSSDPNYNGDSVEVDQDVTTTDDDGAPGVTMALSPSSVAEMGGVATVTARLSHGSGAATTLTVGAASGSFTVGTDATIVIPAEATAAPTDTVLVTAVDNTTDEPNRTATVTATVTNARAAADSRTMTVTGATLTLEDDEAAPGATLSVMPASVSENGGVATVTATLSGLSSEPSTVTVQAVAGAYAAGTDATIVIAAGATTAASDTALVTAVDDDVYQGSAGRSVTVTAALTNGQGAGAVTGASLTLADDDALPTAALALGPASISENGGVSTVRATLSHPTTVATTLTVAAVASTGAVAGDFTLSTAATLTIAAGATTSTGAVTVRGNDNAVDAANKSVTVSATATGGNGVAAPSAVTLTLTDDEATATATLALAPAAILENGEVSTVTAVLSHPTTVATTLTVSAAPVSPAVAGDFTLSSTNTLTIAAGATTSAGVVTITSVDNTAAEGRKRVTVSATAAGGRGVAAPSNATLTIRDDEFGLSESAVSGQATEAGGQATFTVALQTQPSAAVTVAVTSLDTSEGTVAPSSLVFTTGNWETAQTVTVTGVKDNLHDGPQPWRVRLAPSSGDADYDSLDPVDVNGTTTDDEPPEVTLALAPSSISEDGGVATVTAVKEHPSVAETVVTVTAAPVAPAVAGDFTLSAAATLTIAAGETTSTGLVTVTAVNNAVDADNKTVTVSGTAVNAQATMNNEIVDVDDDDAKLTIVDDDEKGLLFLAAGTTASVVEVASGSRAASYTVALNSQPTGPVTVTVAAAGDVRAAPSSLTFTMADWNRAQAVTVTVGSSVGADGYAAALSVMHRASGGDYGGVSASLDVAASVAGATRIAVAADAGTTSYRVEDRLVKVTVAPGLTVASGVTTRIEVDLRGVGPGPELALTFSPWPEDRAAEAAGSEHSLGPAAARVVMNIAVSPVPPGGLRLCLPVTPDVREAAKGRTLLLLRRGERVEGSRDEGAQVCADRVMSFSPFAVGYADTAPSFAVDFPEALSWTVGEEIAPETLPAATGDAPFIYALSPALPDGVMCEGFECDEGGDRLSGAPTAEMAVTRYTWTATDVDGQPVTLEFTIEVVPALAAARERLAAVNRSVLPELSRAMWGSALDAIGARLGAPGGGGSGGGAMEQGLAAAADFLRSKGEALEDGEGSWRELVGGESFALALGGEGEDGSGGGGSAVVMWGGGDWRDLSREDGLLSWSGKLFSAHVGADVALGGGVMGGVAVSRFESAIDYTDRSDEDAGAIEGDHEHRMVAVHPYLGWSGGGGERLWAALGYGHGEVRIADTGIFDRYEWQESDGRLVAGALGGAVPVYGDGDSAVEMRASAEATRYVLADNGEAIAGVSVSTRRVRLATVGSWNWALRGGRLLEPSLEAGLRWDDGDGATGVGVELGGGLAWSDAAAGLSASVSGRSLVAHGSDVEEWGASGSLHMDAGGDGRGLSLSLSPAWGASGSGLARLWEEGMASRDGVGGEGGGRLEGELGYGLAAWGEAGTLTPYGGLALGGDERRYSLGQRLALGTALGLKIEATRSEHPAVSHGLGLELRMSW